MSKKSVLWNVHFVEDYSITTTTVEAKTEDEAIEIATVQLSEYHGRDYARIGGEAERA
jgi:hypothetical protein